jgi:hypothetical protein
VIFPKNASKGDTSMRFRYLALFPLIAIGLAGCSSAPSGPSKHEAKVMYISYVDNYAYHFHLHNPHDITVVHGKKIDVWHNLLEAVHINGCKPASAPKTFTCSGYMQALTPDKTIMNHATFQVMEVGHGKWRTVTHEG